MMKQFANSNLEYEKLFLSQYKSFLENISLKNTKIIKVFSSFENPPFKDESFDLVICNFCFHNINKKNQYLKNLKRILTKNGLLICNYFGENSLIELKILLFLQIKKFSVEHFYDFQNF